MEAAIPFAVARSMERDGSSSDEDGSEAMMHMSLCLGREGGEGGDGGVVSYGGLTESGALSPRSASSPSVVQEAEDSRNMSLVLGELVETEKRFCERVRVCVECFEEPLERWVLELGDASPTKSPTIAPRSRADDASPSLDDVRTRRGNGGL